MEAFPVAKEELHLLLEKPTMEGIPLLVLANKSDLPEHKNVEEVNEALDLDSIQNREVSIYGISVKRETNLDEVMKWMIKHAPK